MVKILLYCKDIVFALLICVSIINELKKKEPTQSILFFVAYLLIWAFFSFLESKDLSNVYTSFRGVLLLPGCILIGRNLPQKRSFSLFLKRYFSSFLFVVALLGILDYVLDITCGTAFFWKNVLKVGDFFTDIKSQSNRLVDGLPGNFYGSYGKEYFSQKRLVSLWISPLTAAYSLVFPTIYYWFALLSKRKMSIKNNIKIIIRVMTFTVATILTLTRAIIIPLILVLVILLYKKKPSVRIPLIFVSIFSLFIFCFIFKDKIISFLYDGSTVGHINAISESISVVSPFGSGFGSVGAYSDVGTESAYLSVFGQIGLLGFAFYVYILFSIIMKLKNLSKKSKNNYFLIPIIISLAIFALTGFISEQLLAFTTAFPIMVLSGYYSTNRELSKTQICNNSSIIFKPIKS